MAEHEHHHHHHHHHHQLKDDPDWVFRMELYFDHLDQDKDGYLTIEHVQSWVSSLATKCKATASQMISLRATLYIYWGELGLKKGGKMSKSEFIEGVNKVGRDDIKKRKAGEITLLDEVSEAWYDCIDQDN